MNPFLPRTVPLLAFCCSLAVAQQPAKPAPTWMDLAPGTDVSYSVVDENKLVGGGGTGSGGSGKHAVRIVSLGADEAGALRIAVIDEQLPTESFETAIVRAEVVLLDPATGSLRQSASTADGPLAVWAAAVAFPYPALSAAEWKAKKPIARRAWTPVAGEPCEVPTVVTFGTRKDGKKQVPTLTQSLDAKEGVTAHLVGIAGIVAMAKGQMPKLGASGVEPVEVAVEALQRDYTFDAAKGRITAVHTTGKVTAADGKVVIACNSLQTETERRVVAAKDLPAVVEVVEAICAIAGSGADKEERKAPAAALQEKAKAAGFGPTAARLLDSLTRDGLPPGLPR